VCICSPCPFIGSGPTISLGFVDLLCSDGEFREELTCESSTRQAGNVAMHLSLSLVIAKLLVILT